MVDTITNKLTTDPIHYIYEVLKIFGDNDIVKKVEILWIEDTIIIKGYIYMKLKIRTLFNGQNLSVCQDTGTDRIFVIRAFFFHFSAVKITRVIMLIKIVGYLGLVTKF